MGASSVRWVESGGPWLHSGRGRDRGKRRNRAFVHVLELDQIAHLEQLSVLPEHGRRGHGRALVEAAKNEARRRGYQSLSLRTYADVPWDGPFYARAGFVETRPATEFHKHLAEVEERLELDLYGRRIQMTGALL